MWSCPERRFVVPATATADMILVAADPALRVRIERALAAAPLASAVVTADIAGLDASRAAHPGAAVLVVGVRRAQVAAALDGGADAVISGPLRLAELRARVRALERRRERSWTVGPLAIDTRGHVVRLEGADLSLPRREFALLRCLASAPGRVFTKAELLSSCWDAGTASPSSRTLERHAARLRRRLGRHGSMLVTVWGIGYRLDEPA